MIGRDRIRALAGKRFFADIEGKTFDGDDEEAAYEEGSQKAAPIFERQNDELEARPEEEELDEGNSEGEDDVECDDEDHLEDLVEQDEQGRMDHVASDGEMMVSAAEDLAEEHKDGCYIEADLNHLNLSDSFEDKMYASEKAASSEDEVDPQELRLEVDKIQLSSLQSQEELDETCFGMLHVLASKMGWSLLPLKCKSEDRKLIICMAPVKKRLRRRSSSYGDEPPVVENLSLVNKGRSSESIQDENLQALNSLVGKLETGQIRFMKKKKNGFMVLSMDTPGISVELVDRCLADSTSEKQAVHKILEKTGMLQLVEALCEYP
uniref:Phosphoprotein n=1 Tax=Suncus murinus rhabdovirus TaxID=3139574 RepID=A0AB38ZKD8_9RHAB